MPFDLSQFNPAPQRVKGSPFLATDEIAEATLGTTGAIMVPMTCMVLWSFPREQIAGGLRKVAFAGSFVHNVDPTNGDGEYQMWNGTLFFLPREKFRKGFPGWLIGDVLTDQFARPEAWKELILDNT